MSKRPEALTIRPSVEEDLVYLKTWFSHASISIGFPMQGDKEVEDALQSWKSYLKLNMGLTALWEGIPCGMAVLYVQSFKKLAHTCLFSIVVSEEKRGCGVGSALLGDLIELAKTSFHIEILHLEVFEGNPAIHLYEKMGFQVYGTQTHFSFEEGKYRSKIFMQKKLMNNDF